MHITVFILQEVWPVLLTAARSAGYSCPDMLGGKYGSTCVLLHIPCILCPFCKVLSNDYYDISAATKAEGINGVGGTSNISCAIIRAADQKIAFVSAHLPFNRKADDMYFDHIEKQLKVAQQAKTEVVLGWDLSDYRSICARHPGLCKKLEYGRVSSARSGNGLVWETELRSTIVLPSNLASQLTQYGRTDHAEAVAVTI
jgi:hypothetical protein